MTVYGQSYVIALLSWPLSGSEPILEFRHVLTWLRAANGNEGKKWSWKPVRQGALNDHIR